MLLTQYPPESGLFSGFWYYGVRGTQGGSYAFRNVILNGHTQDIRTPWDPLGSRHSRTEGGALRPFQGTPRSVSAALTRPGDTARQRIFQPELPLPPPLCCWVLRAFLESLSAGSQYPVLTPSPCASAVCIQTATDGARLSSQMKLRACLSAHQLTRPWCPLSWPDAS